MEENIQPKNDSTNFAKIINSVILIWVLVFSLFIFIPSFSLLKKYVQISSINIPLNPPEQINFQHIDIKVNKNYIDSVKAVLNVKKDIDQIRYNSYIEYVKAYTAYTTNTKSNLNFEVYNKVVKETLLSLFDKLLTAFIGLIGIKTTGKLLNNFISSKYQKR